MLEKISIVKSTNSINTKTERSKRQKIKRRNNLFLEQNGICCYCPTKMIHWDDYLPLMKERKNKIPPDGATIEHLYDRHHPLRRVVSDQNPGKRWAIACNKCNHKKGKESNAAIGKKKLNELSGRSKNPSLKCFICNGGTSAYKCRTCTKELGKIHRLKNSSLYKTMPTHRLFGARINHGVGI
jgi:5-methylcytosine-specific restriction endonuclease McrA